MFWTDFTPIISQFPKRMEASFPSWTCDFWTPIFIQGVFAWSPSNPLSHFFTRQLIRSCKSTGHIFSYFDQQAPLQRSPVSFHGHGPLILHPSLQSVHCSKNFHKVSGPCSCLSSISQHYGISVHRQLVDSSRIIHCSQKGFYLCAADSGRPQPAGQF